MVEDRNAAHVCAQEESQANPGLDKYFGRLDKTKNNEVALATLLANAKLLKCGICAGEGHTAKGCATKKNVDKAVSTFPQLRMLWGGLKAQFKTTGQRVGVKRTAREALARNAGTITAAMSQMANTSEASSTASMHD